MLKDDKINLLNLNDELLEDVSGGIEVTNVGGGSEPGDNDGRVRSRSRVHAKTNEKAKINKVEKTLKERERQRERVNEKARISKNHKAI